MFSQNHCYAAFVPNSKLIFPPQIMYFLLMRPTALRFLSLHTRKRGMSSGRQKMAEEDREWREKGWSVQ